MRSADTSDADRFAVAANRPQGAHRQRRGVVRRSGSAAAEHDVRLPTSHEVATVVVLSHVVVLHDGFVAVSG